jgi:hypothetical protein
MGFPSINGCAQDRTEANNQLDSSDRHKLGTVSFGKRRKWLFHLRFKRSESTPHNAEVGGSIPPLATIHKLK